MKNGLEVVGSGGEEVAEVATDKLAAKLNNPNLDDSVASKCEFIQCVSQETTMQTQGIGDVLCVNVSAVECDTGGENGQSFGQPGGQDCGTQTQTASEQLTDLEKDSLGCENLLTELASRDSSPEVPTPGILHLNHSISCSLSNNEPDNVNSDADERMNKEAPTSPALDSREDNMAVGGHLSDNGITDLAMDDANMPVVLNPDYVVYRGSSCSVCAVIFSCTGVKIKDLITDAKAGTFGFERQIDDIIDIKCQWFQRSNMAVIKLRVLAEGKIDTDAHDTAEIEELQVAVSEPHWTEKKDQITSLSDKYMALCDPADEEDMDMEADCSFGEKQYFPNFDEPFEDVVYPNGDPDAVSISKRDVDLLQPETFVNDTIIDFYIKYLKNQIPPGERQRFHFFNSFFFRKLADLDKDPSSISDGRAAFLRVHKWTRKVDIFGKDYIFIPVNFNLHWSLIVLCHPGEVTTLNDEKLQKPEKLPCILHMDSIKGTHAGLKSLVQSYLMEEWKVRHKDASEDLSLKFLALRFIQLELPQQENSFDCGLFLLHYLELFLAEAPVNFNPFRLIKSSNFLNADWFLPSEASLKRTLIEKLISKLLENRSQELNSTNCDNENQSSGVPENNQREMGTEFLPQNFHPPIGQHEINSGSQGIEMTLLAAASVRMQCVNDSSLVLREFFEPGASAGSMLPQYQSFSQPSSNYHINGTISTREEDGISDEGFVYLPSGENGFQQMSEFTPQAGNISYSRDYVTEAHWNPEVSMQGEHNADSSPDASYCPSDDSEDVGIIEHNPFAQDVSQNFKVRIQHRPLCNESAMLAHPQNSQGLKESTTESTVNIASLTTDTHEEDDNVLCLMNPLAEDGSQGLKENTNQGLPSSMDPETDPHEDDNVLCLMNPLADGSRGLKENTNPSSMDPAACLTIPHVEDENEEFKECTTQPRSCIVENDVCSTDPPLEDGSQGFNLNTTHVTSPSMFDIDPLVKDKIQGIDDTTDEQRSLLVDRTICSVPNELPEISAAEVAEESDKLTASDEISNLTTCQEHLIASHPDPKLLENQLHPGFETVEISSKQDTEMEENEVMRDEVVCNDLPVDGDFEQQAAKRRRITLSSEGEGELPVISAAEVAEESDKLTVSDEISNLTTCQENR